ncbi:MAG: helix-turn-helix domain-containing protein [Alphaproteobacteria bacterium]|nr:helix-turn-helix domain-containing protein [Alphaproteobacteria bacterium]
MKRTPQHTRGARGRAAPGPNPIDIHVGRRLRERRTMLGLSQQEIGRLLGVTFQQIQKNERGTNRMSASRLFEAARVLGTNVQFFFDEMPNEILVSGRRHIQGVSDGPLPDYQPDPMVRRETIELVRAYYEIPERKIRAQMVNTIRAVARVHTATDGSGRPRRGRPPKKPSGTAQKT